MSGREPFLTFRVVIYRSRDAQLPDRSKGGDDGEVFFDVRWSLLSDVALLIDPLA